MSCSRQTPHAPPPWTRPKPLRSPSALPTSRCASPTSAPMPRALVLISAVCVIRGLGFAIMVVAGGSLTAEIIPAQRRGEGLALVGVVAGIPALAALPAGVWLASRAGYPLVFAVAAAASLAALVAVPGLPTGGRGRSPRP